MSSEWTTKPLAEVADWISRGITPAYTDVPGVMVLNQKCIRSSRVTTEYARFTDPARRKIPAEKLLRPFDILINSTGTGTLGRVAQVKTHLGPATVDSHVTIVRPSATVDPLYLGYSLVNQQALIESMGEGSTGQTELSRIRLAQEVYIGLPPVEEQRAIGRLLNALDEKTELNDAINKNLEELAHALFVQWFVEFEFPNDDGQPYKSSGGPFEDSDVGPIPAGWTAGTIQDLVIAVSGGDWGKDSPQGNHVCEVACIRGADIPELRRGARGKVPRRFILPKHADGKSLSHGDIVIEISGGSPTQSTGRTLLVVDDLLAKFDTPLICTNFCRVLKPVPGYGEYLYSLLSHLYQQGALFQYENGTTGIKNLDIASLLNVHRVAVPRMEVVSRYAGVFRELYRTIHLLGTQSDYLAQLRDALLPKLMSGEIRVPAGDLEFAPKEMR